MTSNPCQKSTSPKWIRPTEVLCLRKKAKRQHSAALQPLDSNILANRFTGPLSNQLKVGTFNPFRKVSQKRKIDDVIPVNSESFDGLSPIENVTSPTSAVYKKESDSWTPAVLDESANSAPSKVIENVKESPARVTQLPLDWSLKTRIRFMSSTPFPFRGSLKTCEEASGITGFVRCIHSTRVQECSVDTSANAKFHQQCLVWQHPALPWLKLFPRFNDSKSSQTSIFTSNQALQDSIQEDWMESLRSLFQLLRACQCPFFYLCGNSFTALFRAAGISGIADAHVLLTPTTKGIRKVLRSHGIEFTMPLSCKVDSQDQDLSNYPFANELDVGQTGDAENLKEEDKEDEEPETFLESLGLSQQDFPSLNPKRRKLDQDVTQDTSDMQAESLVLMEGPDAFLFLDYLLKNVSSSLCTPLTGPLAGVPPTLLAPCAFPGAVLKRVKARQGWVKQGSDTLHCIDLSGTILPNMVQGLASLFSETQEGKFSAVLATEPSTSTFTSVPADQGTCMPSVFATENLKDCGLATDFVKQMCCSSELAVLHEIDAQEKRFSCR